MPPMRTQLACDAVDQGYKGLYAVYKPMGVPAWQIRVACGWKLLLVEQGEVKAEPEFSYSASAW